MKRTKIDDRTLPSYTRGEEIFNMTSHIVGAGLGVMALISCVIVSCMHGGGIRLLASIIYGISLILLYTISSIYHGLKTDTPKQLRAKKIMQIFDHCSIFVLIAGSYTPFALIAFMKYDPAFAWGLFGVIWGLAAIGITLDAIDLRMFRVISKIIYFVMGWFIIFRINLLPKLITWPGTILLVLGGITYTVGAIFFALGMKKKWMHSVFHLFIIAASIFQFFSIIMYVL